MPIVNTTQLSLSTERMLVAGKKTGHCPIFIELLYAHSFKIFDGILDDSKILQAAADAINLEKLELDEAHNSRVRKLQLLKGWRILLPAVFKICHK